MCIARIQSRSTSYSSCNEVLYTTTTDVGRGGTIGASLAAIAFWVERWFTVRTVITFALLCIYFVCKSSSVLPVDNGCGEQIRWGFPFTALDVGYIVRIFDWKASFMWPLWWPVQQPHRVLFAFASLNKLLASLVAEDCRVYLVYKAIIKHDAHKVDSPI